jgi:hypothetical protein
MKFVFSPISFCQIAALASTICLSNVANAHELSSNRATLVLRNKQHLTITFFVDYAKVLHQALAPKKPLQEFLAQAAATPEKEFKSQLAIAQEKLQARINVTLASGKAATLTQWTWPNSKFVHSLLQQRAMQAIVAPKDHAHGTPLEIRAEANSANSKDFRSIKLNLPAEFQQVLVVAYSPKQVWMKPNEASPAITFE